MKDLRNMTDYQRQQAMPPYRWLQIAIVCFVTGAAILFVSQFIAVMVIGIVATFRGLM